MRIDSQQTPYDPREPRERYGLEYSHLLHDLSLVYRNLTESIANDLVSAEEILSKQDENHEREPDETGGLEFERGDQIEVDFIVVEVGGSGAVRDSHLFAPEEFPVLEQFEGVFHIYAFLLVKLTGDDFEVVEEFELIREQHVQLGEGLLIVLFFGLFFLFVN